MPTAYSCTYPNGFSKETGNPGVNSCAGLVGHITLNPAPQVELEMIEALDRVLREALAVPPSITITQEESSTPAINGE